MDYKHMVEFLAHSLIGWQRAAQSRTGQDVKIKKRSKVYAQNIKNRHMTSERKHLLVLLLVCLVFPCHAQFTVSLAERENEEKGDREFGMLLAVKGGTWGVGPELVVHVMEDFDVRLGISRLSTFFRYKEQNELEVDLRVRARTANLLIAYQPGNYFYVVGGLAYNQNEALIEAEPLGSQSIGAIEVDAETIGLVETRLTWTDYAPYLGIGIGEFYSRTNRITFTGEFGLIYTGKPEVDLRATGMLNLTATEANQALIAENVQNFTFWPIISFQIGIRLF